MDESEVTLYTVGYRSEGRLHYPVSASGSTAPVSESEEAARNWRADFSTAFRVPLVIVSYTRIIRDLHVDEDDDVTLLMTTVKALVTSVNRFRTSENLPIPNNVEQAFEVLKKMAADPFGYDVPEPRVRELMYRLARVSENTANPV